MTERALQRQVFEYLRSSLPRGAVAFAIPGGDGKVTLAPGYLSGIPDICIVHRGKAIFIELKFKNGPVKPVQTFIHACLTSAGAVVAVCRSLDEVQGFLSQIIPLKGRVAA